MKRDLPFSAFFNIDLLLVMLPHFSDFVKSAAVFFFTGDSFRINSVLTRGTKKYKINILYEFSQNYYCGNYAAVIES